MTACVEFHSDGQGDLLNRWKERSKDNNIVGVDEIDIYDSTYEIFLPECELGLDAYHMFMSCLQGDKDSWHLYITGYSMLGWEKSKRRISRTELQKGVWKELRFHGWPSYLEGAELSSELILGNGLPPLVSEGAKTEFPKGEEGYDGMFALAKVSIDRLYELLVDRPIDSRRYFLNKSDDLLDPSFIEGLYLSSEENDLGRERYLLNRDSICFFYEAFHYIRPYDEYMILAKRGILKAPEYKFPPADRSMFG